MKLNYNPLLAILLMVVVFTSGCVSPETAQKPSSNLYKNDIYGFSIEYPKNWEIEENFHAEGINTIVVFRGQTEKGFQTNINIITENAKKYTLDKYVQENKRILPQFYSLNNYLLINEGSLTINNHEAYFLEYALINEGTPLMYKQVLLINHNNAYIITYTSLQNTFSDNVIDFDNSVSTFKFTK